MQPISGTCTFNPVKDGFIIIFFRSKDKGTILLRLYYAALLL